jgi:cytochrome c553
MKESESTRGAANPGCSRLFSRLFGAFCASLLLATVVWCEPNPSQEFSQSIRPVLVQNCAACHNPANTRNPAAFLKAATVTDMESNRTLWRNVAAQMRNRTMPPTASKLTEEDRFRISSWIENRLRQTACGVGEYAGASIARRLNRREYHNTIRDLFGIDFEVLGILPADGTGGAGFDTNGETLFVPPVLTERYMEAAQQILDRVIITAPLMRTFSAAEVLPSLSVSLPIYQDGKYEVQVAFATGQAPKMSLKVDGAQVGSLVGPPLRYGDQKGKLRAQIARLQVNLARGTHSLSIVSEQPVGKLSSLTVQQKPDTASADKKAAHYRLLGMEPGERPLQTRKAARQVLAALLPKAFRRPVQPAEIDRFLKLYDRAAERGDPYEERIKLALKAVLVWPDFLFRIEQKHEQPGIYPLSQYELATRLSYFLWSSMPDETLFRLAEEQRLQDPKVLSAQVERMLDDPRSRTFISSFIGQWLGTQDIGGRVVPLLTELQSYYTPEVAADLREQPILLLDRILGEDRSLLELLDANYTHLTRRLAKFYQIEDQVKGLDDNEFHLVQWPDNHRAGLIGLGGILAMTSRYMETSPVLRGAWALETLLGTPVPPPPPDVPPLKTDAESVKLPVRELLMRHRADPSCSACHNMMDPIGLGLENFDWMGRWRDKQPDGKPIDAMGTLPSGEKFNGPVELRQALLARKDDFIRNLSGRVLGYALGRSLQDGDSCTVQRMVRTLAKDGYRGRTLIREIVLSVPFRNTQGGAVSSEPVITQKPLDISGLNALKQDNESHLNLVKPEHLTPKR